MPVHRKSIPQATARYVPFGAQFDGTNDFIRFSHTITNVSNGKAFTLAFWMRMDAHDSQLQQILDIARGAASRERVHRDANNKLTILGSDTGGAAIVLGTNSTDTIKVTNGWTHVYICVDTSSTANRHVYLNGTESTMVWSVYATNTVMELNPTTSPSTTVGATVTSGNLLQGALGDLWFDDVYFNDPTKFVSGGLPVYLGAHGELPTGSTPAIYLSTNGCGNSWVVDSSTSGNTFTVTGSLDCTTGP